MMIETRHISIDKDEEELLKLQKKIDNRNFYCGDKTWAEAQQLNDAEGNHKYDVEGNLSMCFKKGTGVGLRLAARALVAADGRSVRSSRKSSSRKKLRRRSR